MKPTKLCRLLLLLLFMSVGCEKKLTKSTEPAELTEPTKSLHQAAADGDLEIVKSLISKGADVNAKDERENTPLCYAVKSGKMEVVQLLVESGADVNAMGKNDRPPLYMAVEEDNIAIAEYLFAHGADVNAGDDGTALQQAPYSSSIEMIQLLIDKGADVNAGPWTALHGAVDEGRRDIAEFLIRKGARVNAKDKRGNPPLYYAIQKKDSDTAKLLITHGADVNAKDKRGLTTLHRAGLNGLKDIAELLLAHGADVNVRDSRGRTPLHFVLDADRFKYRLFKDVAELFIAKRADVNSKDEYGRTPLHLAAESADEDIIELLLAKGAKIDEEDDEYAFTALHYAARFGNKNVAELLIARGANINAKDKEGRTPLYIAVHHDYKVAELLINRGADGDIKTKSGQALFQLAQERKQIESAVPDMIFDADPNSLLGARIACADVDGDGYDDILISRRKYGIENDRGRVYLFYGGPDMDTSPDLIFEGEQEGDRFGFVSCGDVDNDGYEDIVIVAIGYKDNRGRAYLYWGSKRNSMDTNPDKIFDGEGVEGSRFGLSYPGPVMYDIDNDGYRDIIFGAVRYPGDGTGRAYLYYGNTKQLMDTSYDLIFTAEKPGDNFGSSIGCGDVDNDGYGDVLIGARHFPSGDPPRGRAYLYYGDKRDNMDAKADKIFDAESPGNNYFGQGIVCHDFNNDGYDDVVIGAQGYKGRQGRAYLFYGGTRANLDTVPDKTFDGEIEWSDYSFRIVRGDIDGDNYDDILIGADHFRKQVGRVYIYWGSELSGSKPKPGRIFTGENPGEWFSIGLACGDVNKDGYDDLVIGAPRYKAGSEQGRVYLYYGGPRRNR